jgi:predicted Zn-dependent protease
MSDGGTGYAHRASARVGDIDATAAGKEAVEKALRTRDATAIEPGVYPVVLEEYAVTTLLEYMSYIGFSALSVEEGRSFMRLSEKVTGENINIWDDGNDRSGFPMPFDFEGIARRRVDLITGGVATGLVHDMASAARAGVESTGHGLPAPNPYGAHASNVFLGSGETAREEIASGIERGVWVTRLWYVNTVRPRDCTLTGMTRDGTFLIEKGKVVRPIKDMRFTQSITEALRGTVALSRERRLCAGEDYDYHDGYSAPALQLKAFYFSSVTR